MKGMFDSFLLRVHVSVFERKKEREREREREGKGIHVRDIKKNDLFYLNFQ